MIVLSLVVDSENNCNLRIEIVLVQTREIRFGIEDQPVGSTEKRFLYQEKRFHPTIVVGPGVAEFRPRLVRILHIQVDGDTTSRLAARHVEYVSGNGAHSE